MKKANETYLTPSQNYEKLYETAMRRHTKQHQLQ